MIEQEATNNFLRQAHEIWITPEWERRKAAGQLVLDSLYGTKTPSNAGKLSCGLAFLPVVIVDYPSKHFSPLDPTLSGTYLPVERRRYLLINSLMRSPHIIVITILQEHSLQMSIAYD